MLQISRKFGCDTQNSNVITRNVEDKSVQTNEDFADSNTTPALPTITTPFTKMSIDEVTNHETIQSLEEF